MIRDDKYGKIHTDGSRSGGQPLDDSIEAKALALLNEVNVERGYAPYSKFDRDFDHTSEALCRAIENHEAFKQQVSDVMTYIKALYPTLPRNFNRFIIPKPKPDPLVEALKSLAWDAETSANQLRAALEARGLEIRSRGAWKEAGQPWLWTYDAHLKGEGK
jgi:hypothetical protein